MPGVGVAGVAPGIGATPGGAAAGAGAGAGIGAVAGGVAGTEAGAPCGITVGGRRRRLFLPVPGPASWAVASRAAASSIAKRRIEATLTLADIRTSLNPVVHRDRLAPSGEIDGQA